ncbi:MAG: CHAD domain-containing protein [Pirellulaceae bacterium]|jgi:CHAD domain-containing protein|nr:CHAD domain-containing protein [Pirellulaceae bacterium]MDP6557099.1 CHAD domain-containing protein [Pirellulaceae bacterium]
MMPEINNWMQDITYDVSVCDAARRSLRAKLSMVEHYLPLAAKHATEDIEHVHKLRVATRRTIAALTLFADVLPVKQTRWLRKHLKRLRRATGKARDLDVVASKQAGQRFKRSRKFAKRIHRERKLAQRPINKFYRRLIPNDSLARHVDDFLDQIGKDPAGSEHACFGDWARSRLECVVKRFFESVPRQKNDLKSLHRFRIRGKELRYAMELLAPAFPPEFHEELSPIVETLQDRLGKINDHAVGCARFERWIKSSKKKHRRCLRKQLNSERGKLKSSMRKFDRWWTPEFSNEVLERFDRFLNPHPLTMLNAAGHSDPVCR